MTISHIAPWLFIAAFPLSILSTLLTATWLARRDRPLQARRHGARCTECLTYGPPHDAPCDLCGFINVDKAP